MNVLNLYENGIEIDTFEGCKNIDEDFLPLFMQIDVKWLFFLKRNLRGIKALGKGRKVIKNNF
jgi:hypothetical protein